MANEDAGRTGQVTATEDEDRARAVGARKPGVVGRMIDRCRKTVESIRLPRPDWRTFAWGLLLLILVVFIVRNWAPLRINLFGWYLDAPRAVVLAIFFALGMVTAWLIEFRNKRARAAEDEEPEREHASSHETPPLVAEIGSQDVSPSPEDFADEVVAEDAEELDVSDREPPEPEETVNDDQPEAGETASEEPEPQEPQPEGPEPEPEAFAEAKMEEDADEPVAEDHYATPEERDRYEATLQEEAVDEDQDAGDDWFSPVEDLGEVEDEPESDEEADGSEDITFEPAPKPKADEAEEPLDAPVVEEFASAEDADEEAGVLSEADGEVDSEDSGAQFAPVDGSSGGDDSEDRFLPAEDATAEDALSDEYGFDEPAGGLNDVPADEPEASEDGALDDGGGVVDENLDATDDEDEDEDGGPISLPTDADEPSNDTTCDEKPFWKFWARGESTS